MYHYEVKILIEILNKKNIGKELQYKRSKFLTYNIVKCLNTIRLSF